MIIIILAAALLTLLNAKPPERDLDRDGMPEKYVLDNGRLTVTEEGKLLWKSEKDWIIDGFALGDANNDGRMDLVMSLWKTGSYGPAKPFWNKSRDSIFKNHLFVYELKNKTFFPVWCSSELDNPIISFKICDTDGDGQNELEVKEGVYMLVSGDVYALDKNAPARKTVWKWKEWGFYLQADT